MENTKKVTVRDAQDNIVKETEVETIEEALKDLAREAAEGDLPLPYKVSFPGPGGTTFDVTVSDADAAEALSRQGFMY